MKSTKRGIFRGFCVIWVGITVVVMLFFFVFYAWIGGSAISGYSEGEKYFVSDHGKVTEVSREIWEVSRISEVFFFFFIYTTGIGGSVVNVICQRKERNEIRPKK